MINIMAYGEPDHEMEKKFVIESLRDNISRFFYSYIDNCDLNRLAKIPANQMSADEKEIWRRGKRLLNLKAGDYILHKHIPERGKVTAVRLCSKYFYDANPKPIDNSGRQDGRHCFHVDKIFEFRRDEVNPQLQTKLKVMGALYKIPDVKDFFESMQALGMPFDEADRVALTEFEATLTNSVTSTGNGFTTSINSVPQQTSDLNSPLKKISAIRENYLKELLKVLCNMSPDDPSRNEVIENILETLRMFSPDALKNIIKGLFVKNGYRLIDDKSDLVFEMFSERELMHELYKPAVEPKKIFVRLKTNDEPYNEPPNSDGDIRILIDLTNHSDATTQGNGVIFIGNETFANVLTRHGV